MRREEYFGEPWFELGRCGRQTKCGDLECRAAEPSLIDVFIPALLLAYGAE